MSLTAYIFIWDDKWRWQFSIFLRHRIRVSAEIPDRHRADDMQPWVDCRCPVCLLTPFVYFRQTSLCESHAILMSARTSGNAQGLLCLLNRSLFFISSMIRSDLPFTCSVLERGVLPYFHTFWFLCVSIAVYLPVRLYTFSAVSG